MVENTAVYPTKYYAEQLKGVDPRFYVERSMIVTVPEKNPNAVFSPEIIVLPRVVRMEYLFEKRLGEKQIQPQMIEVPFEPTISKSVLEIDKKDLQYALQTDMIEKLGADHLSEDEILDVKQTLLSWIDKKAEEKALRLTEETKTLLMNIMALIMKKTNEIVRQSKGG